ncbi:MAG: LamG-like jellyroll fold domain-containing protein [Bacteroidota bacterium]
MKHLISSLILGVLLCMSSFAQINIQNGLIAHYPLNGNANDVSGNGNNGTPNGVTSTTDRNGNVNSAYSFDGTDDFISLLNNQNFQPQLPVSISAWIRPTATGDLGPIFSNEDTENQYFGINMLLSSTNRAAGAFYSGGAPSPAGRRTGVGSSTIATNQWNHVTVVIRGAADMTLYVNGKLECETYSGTGGALLYPGTSPGGAIGRADANAGNNNSDFFEGDLDEIRFYDRELNKEEVRFLAEAPSSINNTDTICAGDTTMLDGGFGNTFTWTPATGLSCTTCPNPLAFPTVTTTYTGISQGTDPSCSDTVVWTVVVSDTCDPCAPVDCNVSFDFNVIAQRPNYIFQPSPQPVGVDAIRWETGDGAVYWRAPNELLVHAFPQSGNYTVCATVFRFPEDGAVACSQTLCRTIFVEFAGSRTSTQAAPWEVSQNLEQKEIQIKKPFGMEGSTPVKIFDIQGRLIRQVNMDSEDLKLFVGGWAKGVYLIKMGEGENTYSEKIIIR